jgi:hypothetical protein
LNSSARPPRIRQFAAALFLFCAACSGDSEKSTSEPHNAPSPPSLSVQVSGYATRIADVSKTIHDCVSAEARASAEHPDTEYMTDKEVGICGGDDKAIGDYLSFSAPNGFGNTDSNVATLKADLENHNADNAISDSDLHIEAADMASIVSAFTADLSRSHLTQEVKQRILKRLHG